MIVYHGSKEKFDSFNYDKMGLNGTAEGFGFYFTDSKTIASGYAQDGYLYTVEFMGQKPLSFNSITITRAQLRRYLKRLDETGQFLANYGETAYEGFDKVMREAINSIYDFSDNDVDIIGGICTAYGNREEPLKELYKLLGYDSITVQAEWGAVPHKIYIATVHEAYNIINVETRNTGV